MEVHAECIQVQTQEPGRKLNIEWPILGENGGIHSPWYTQAAPPPVQSTDLDAFIPSPQCACTPPFASPACCMDVSTGW